MKYLLGLFVDMAKRAMYLRGRTTIIGNAECILR
jgi:hypothetical protein